MLKHLPPKLRFVFIGSLVLNILFILWWAAGVVISSYLDSTGALDYARINSMQNEFCSFKFQRVLDNIDKQYGDDPQRAAALKNNFAINVCLKNYKTGQRLDVQPLVDQVK
jgi:hypothetical protein